MGVSGGSHGGPRPRLLPQLPGRLTLVVLPAADA